MVDMMGKRKRRRHTPEPPPGLGRRLIDRLSWPAFVIAVAMLAVGGLAKLYLLVESLLSGTYRSALRAGPARIFLVDIDPQGYWLWMAWDGFFTVLLLLLAGIAAHVLLARGKSK